MGLVSVERRVVGGDGDVRNGDGNGGGGGNVDVNVVDVEKVYDTPSLSRAKHVSKHTESIMRLAKSLYIYVVILNL